MALSLRVLLDGVLSLIDGALYDHKRFLVRKELFRLALLRDDLIGHHGDKRAERAQADFVVGAERLRDGMLYGFVKIHDAQCITPKTALSAGLYMEAILEEAQVLARRAYRFDLDPDAFIRRICGRKRFFDEPEECRQVREIVIRFDMECEVVLVACSSIK